MCWCAAHRSAGEVTSVEGIDDRAEMAEFRDGDVAKFIIFNTQFLAFDTQFLVFESAHRN